MDQNVCMHKIPLKSHRILRLSNVSRLMFNSNRFTEGSNVVKHYLFENYQCKILFCPIHYFVLKYFSRNKRVVEISLEASGQ